MFERQNNLHMCTLGRDSVVCHFTTAGLS